MSLSHGRPCPECRQRSGHSWGCPETGVDWDRGEYGTPIDAFPEPKSRHRKKPQPTADPTPVLDAFARMYPGPKDAA